MAEIAAGVLHDVGNVLNSLGIANSAALRDLKAMRLERLELAFGRFENLPRIRWSDMPDDMISNLVNQGCRFTGRVHSSHFCTSTSRFSKRFTDKNGVWRSQDID